MTVSKSALALSETLWNKWEEVKKAVDLKRIWRRVGWLLVRVHMSCPSFPSLEREETKKREKKNGEREREREREREIKSCSAFSPSFYLLIVYVL